MLPLMLNLQMTHYYRMKAIKIYERGTTKALASRLPFLACISRDTITADSQPEVRSLMLLVSNLPCDDVALGAGTWESRISTVASACTKSIDRKSVV